MEAWEQEQKDMAEGKIVEKAKPDKKTTVKKAGTGTKVRAEAKPKTPGKRTPVKKDVETTKTDDSAAPKSKVRRDRSNGLEC